MDGNAPSRWAMISQVPEANSHLMQFCQQIGLPVEVRYLTCNYFERQDWDVSDVAMCRGLKEKFLETLAPIIGQLFGPLSSLKQPLERAHQKFEGMDPVEFVGMMKMCADRENEIISLISRSPDGDYVMVQQDLTPCSPMEEARRKRVMKDKQIRKELENIRIKADAADKKVKELQHSQELFVIQFQNNEHLRDQYTTYRTQVEQMQDQLPLQNSTEEERYRKLQAVTTKLADWKKEIDGKDLKLAEIGNNLLQSRKEVKQTYTVIIKELHDIQVKILDEELMGWKRRQQLSFNGGHLDKEELSLLQDWCELLAIQVWTIRKHIKVISILQAQVHIECPAGTVDLLPQIDADITTMLSSLVTSTFIVETQPPQVLKKEARFSTGVRILVGGALNLQMNAPTVTATIISEHQAKRLLVHKDMDVKRESCGEILNNAGNMDYSQDSRPEHYGSLSIHFRNMQLKRIRRSDKRGGETVCEEKFCILFQSNFNVGGPDLRCEVWMLSLPVVVTVHGNQECHAMGTILWDNAFCEPGRDPFVVPDAVPWPQLADQLSLKFHQATGRGLTKENLDYLASKIFNVQGVKPDFSGKKISWAQFNKEPLKERAFTLWEWFHAVLKLTKEYVKGPWVDGNIIGFISKWDAQEYLKEKCNNTFLLRFSDSECGCISVAWIDMVDPTKQTLERDVWNLSPYGAKDFQVRALGDRLKDLKNLIYLYPNIPKDVAFSKYYTAAEAGEKLRNGYVASELRTTIPVAEQGASRGNATYNPLSPCSDGSNTPFRPGTLDDLMEMEQFIEELQEDGMTENFMGLVLPGSP